MPGEVVVGGRKDETDKARRARIDVAIGADKASRDGTHAPDDAGGALLGAGRIPLGRVGHKGSPTLNPHR